MINALESRPYQFQQIWLVATRQDSRFNLIEQYAHKHNIPCLRVIRSQLESELANPEVNHQGVIAWCSPMKTFTEEELPSLTAGIKPQERLFLVLDQVTDPRNLGACIRSAAVAGVQAVILPKAHSAPLNAEARKAAAGGTEVVPVVQVSNLARCLKNLQASGVWLVGLDESGSQPIDQMDFVSAVALVVGAEDKGLRTLTKKHCDFLVHLPTKGQFATYNVAVATGIGLFEVLRQRRTNTL